LLVAGRSSLDSSLDTGRSSLDSPLGTGRSSLDSSLGTGRSSLVARVQVSRWSKTPKPEARARRPTPARRGAALAGLPAGQPTVTTSGVRSEQGKARGRTEQARDSSLVAGTEPCWISLAYTKFPRPAGSPGNRSLGRRLWACLARWEGKPGQAAGGGAVASGTWRSRKPCTRFSFPTSLSKPGRIPWFRFLGDPYSSAASTGWLEPRTIISTGSICFFSTGSFPINAKSISTAARPSS
jgi:hypothetical protein